MQIDDKPERIGLRYPAEVGLVGDAKATLRVLLPLLSRSEDRSFLTTAQDGMKAWWRLLEHRADARGRAVHEASDRRLGPLQGAR